MAVRAVPSQRFVHPRLGRVHVVARANATRFVARWKGSELQLTIPRGVTIAEVEQAIEAMMPSLLSTRPEQRGFYVGWTYQTPEMVFKIVANERPGYLGAELNEEDVKIKIPADISGTDPRLISYVNGVLDRYATVTGESVLIPQAISISSRLGVSPKEWRIGRGENRRGSCSSRGVITLSRNLVFFPLELREYVICHELAHLTHFDHSPSFYALLDQYLDGQEARLRKMSNAHRLPFIR